MTVIYARIADKTVADEYFAVPRRSKHCTANPADSPPTTLRIHLRILQLLRHHHRVPAHPATASRRRGPQGPDRAPEGLSRRPQPTRHQRILTRRLTRSPT